jgi:hypothetical protein
MPDHHTVSRASMDCDCAFDTTGHASCGVSTSKRVSSWTSASAIHSWLIAMAGPGKQTLESPSRRVCGWRQFEGLEGKLLPQFSDHEVCILTTNMKGENIW